MNHIEWSETKRMIAGLWTSWHPNDETLVLWDDVFGNLNQDWLRTAIRRVRQEYSSAEPQIKWIKSEFERVKGENSHTYAVSRDEQVREELRRERFAVIDDQKWMREQIAQSSAERVATARAEVDRIGIAGSECGSDPQQWGDMYVGLVWAAIERASHETQAVGQ